MPFIVFGLIYSASAVEWGIGWESMADISGTPIDDDYAKFTDANTIEGRSYAEVLSDLSLDANLKDLTAAEIGQLENIGTSTLSAAQWGYLGGSGAGGGQFMANLTTGESTQLEAIGSVTISSAQWTGLGGATTAGMALWDDAAASNQRTTLGGVPLTSEVDVEMLIDVDSEGTQHYIMVDDGDGTFTFKLIDNNSISSTAAIAQSKIAWPTTITTRDADATPEVAPGGFYKLTNTGALSVTNFLDSDGDESEFSTGDEILVLLDDADIKLIFNGSSALERTGTDLDFTASATLVTLTHWIYENNRWNCTNLPPGYSDPSTFSPSTIQGSMKVYTYASAQTLTASQMNSIVIMTGAGDVNIPADQCDSATGKWITIKSSAAHLNSLTSNDGTDAFVLSDGTDCGNADELDLAGAAGNQVTCVCLQANKWWVTGEIGACVDGGAAD